MAIKFGPIKGLDKLNSQLRDLKRINPGHALLLGAFVLQRASMENCPVGLTGFLRASHESVETEGGAEMRVNAEYAGYVEFGTSKMAARPFARTAIDTESDKVVATVAEELEKQIKEVI